MTNGYFENTDPLARGTSARAEAVNAIIDSIEAGFDKLPDELRLKQDRITLGTDTGAANAYVVVLPYPPAAYTVGQRVAFIPANGNTGPSTINVNSLGVKAIKRFDGTDLLIGDIPAGAFVELRYDGTDFRMQIVPLDVTRAQEWASLLDAQVDGIDYSAKEYAIGTTVPAGSAKFHADAASASATAASGSAAAALASENNAAASEANAVQSAADALQSENNAATSESNAADSEQNAANSAASINLPALSGQANNFLRVLANESGYTHVSAGTIVQAGQASLTSVPSGAIAASAVTQHQAALSIAWAQITGTKNADQVGGVALAGLVQTSRTINAGGGLSGGGSLAADRTISHADTSSQGSINNSNGTVIQDVTLDTYGHVSGLASVNLDGRYYTETEVNSLLAGKANSSHTHSATEITSGTLPSARLPTTHNTVGSFAFCYKNSPGVADFGDVISGVNLYTTTAAGGLGTQLSGTWRCMGFSNGADGSPGSITLWQKVS